MTSIARYAIPWKQADVPAIRILAHLVIHVAGPGIASTHIRPSSPLLSFIDPSAFLRALRVWLTALSYAMVSPNLTHFVPRTSDSALQ